MKFNKLVAAIKKYYETNKAQVKKRFQHGRAIVHLQTLSHVIHIAKHTHIVNVYRTYKKGIKKIELFLRWGGHLNNNNTSSIILSLKLHDAN